MELDELKKGLNERMAVTEQRSVAEIASLLKKDTGSIIQKLTRSMRVEMAFAIIFTLGSIILAIYSNSWTYSMYFGVFSGLGVIFIVVLYLLQQKTSRLSGTSLPVKGNLQAIIQVLKLYVKRYMQLGVILMPLCFVFAVWLSYNDPGKIQKPLRWDVMLYLSINMFVLSVGFYYFTRWYLKKLYGNYLNQLQESLDELED